MSVPHYHHTMSSGGFPFILYTHFCHPFDVGGERKIYRSYIYTFQTLACLPIILRASIHTEVPHVNISNSGSTPFPVYLSSLLLFSRPSLPPLPDVYCRSRQTSMITTQPTAPDSESREVVIEGSTQTLAKSSTLPPGILSVPQLNSLLPQPL